MPKDVVHVTILRDPADQFLSVFEQFKLGGILGINSTDLLTEFLSNPWFYLERALGNENIEAIEFHRLQLARNGMLFDLGFNPQDYDNTESIRSYIKRLDKEFELVMLTEYFTESLVLLKYLMCWDFDDVVYFVLNARQHSSQRYPVTQSLKNRIRDWNGADYLLYKHFNGSFWEKVNSYGEEFHRDVNILRNKVKHWRNTCSATKNRTTSSLRNLNRTIGTTSWMCRKLLTNETSYIEYFQQRQNV
jgi:galactosylceramide sulfotransferase